MRFCKCWLKIDLYNAVRRTQRDRGEYKRVEQQQQTSVTRNEMELTCIILSKCGVHNSPVTNGRRNARSTQITPNMVV